MAGRRGNCSCACTFARISGGGGGKTFFLTLAAVAVAIIAVACGGSDSSPAPLADAAAAERSNNLQQQRTDSIVAGTGRFTAVSAGYAHSCGLRDTGAIECWGNNDASQALTPPASAGAFRAVSAGRYLTCGLRSDGAITCWGGAAGQDPQGRFTAVSAGYEHACAIRENGEIECWGTNDDGQADAPGGSFSAVSSGSRHTCGLRESGEIECWGASGYGIFEVPDLRFGENRYVAVSAGERHACALSASGGFSASGLVVCWGEANIPAGAGPDGSLYPFVSVGAGNANTCAVRATEQYAPDGGPPTDGELVCWGWNAYGQGDAPAGRFTAVSVGGAHACGLTTAGAIECWGANESGQLDAPAPTVAQNSAGPSASDDREQTERPSPERVPARDEPRSRDEERQQARSDGDAPRSTLAAVQEHRELLCGVKQTQPLFGFRRGDGSVVGFDIEFCKAIAAAVGSNVTVRYVDASDASTRFELLASGRIDVLIRTTTITASRDAHLNVDFAQPTFYTGQGFAVHADSGIQSIADMRSATICVQTGTTTEQNLADHFADLGYSYTPLGGTSSEIQEAFRQRRCDVFTADQSYLASLVSTFNNPASYRVLGQVISKEPLAPGVRDYDSDWKDLVNWVVHGLVAAEEIGITQSNVAAMAANPPNTTIARLLGVRYRGGEISDLGFGVDPQFIQRAIRAVGNYGEIYERTVGDYIPRACTLNALAIDNSVDCPAGSGGIQYAFPYR